MAVCNLFNKLNKTTGNFLLFSQYTEDLTRSNTHPGMFRVSPSHFIVMDVDYSKYDPFSKETNKGYTDANVNSKVLNSDIPTYFQNYFENGCAYMRENSEKTVNETEFPIWTPNIFTSLFWNALYDSSLLTKTDDNICSEIKYIGDINIHTYDEHLGMGYSEIYCNIPSDSQPQDIKCVIADEINRVTFKDKVVMGYKPDEYKPEIGMCDIKIAGNKDFDYYYNPIFSLEYLDKIEKYKAKENIKEYNFNTMILLYDTYDIGADGKYHLAYKNIPMGMYICGTIGEDGNTTNPGKKIVSNPDIYEMGTSYGLRICSRFVTTPNNENIKPIDIKVECDSSYAATCMVLSELSKSITKMNEIVAECAKGSQFNKELLSVFKNSRVNVPYIKEIGGQNFWFINGRNTYIPSDGSVTIGGIDSITKEYIDTLFQNMRLKMVLGYR